MKMIKEGNVIKNFIWICFNFLAAEALTGSGLI